MDLDASTIACSGLFDPIWYVATYPEVGGHPDLPLHFCREGWQKGFRPNPYFDPAWYAQTYGAEFLPDENPLLHYIGYGERENAWPSPDFDPEWFRDKHDLGENESPLRHYLLHRAAGLYSPLPSFDPLVYTQENPDWPLSGLDPYLHWLRHSREEPPSVVEAPVASILRLTGGDLDAGIFPEAVPWKIFKDVIRLLVPFIPFDEAWYCELYPDVAEALKSGALASAHAHFIDHGFFEGRIPGPTGITANHAG